MPTSPFSRSMAVAADRHECWSTLTDVPRLVGWVDVVEDARELSPLETYTAVLLDRLGPFKLRADLDIRLTDVEVGRHIRVTAEGEDRQVRSRLSVAATLDIEEVDGGGSRVVVEGTYEVTGRVASMGSGTIRKKAERILDDFFSEVASTLREA